MHEFGGVGEVSDVLSAVAVAGEDDRDVVFAAAAQDLAVVGSGVSSVAVGGEGASLISKITPNSFAATASVS